MTGNARKGWGGVVLAWALGAGLLLSLAAGVPILPCPVCEGEGPTAAKKWENYHGGPFGWHCGFCRDAGRVSVYARILRAPLAPRLAALVRASLLESEAERIRERRMDLLAANALEPERTTEGPHGWGYPVYLQRFVQPEGEACFLIILCGSRGQYRPRHPDGPARILLFSAEGLLLDVLDGFDRRRFCNIVLREVREADGVALIFDVVPPPDTAHVPDVEIRSRHAPAPRELGDIRTLQVELRDGRLVATP